MSGHHNRETVRLFFALLPDAKTVAAIDSHVARYSPLSGRKVKPENYHITLLFLGNVERRMVDALCMDCGDIHSPPFTLTFAEAGWWKKAGILFLAPENTPLALDNLVNTLDSLAGQRHLARDRHRYFPHLTLMRKVVEAPLHPLVRPFPWQADSFSLMQSITHSTGVEYRELARWPLVD